jgi:hypothetical protein
VYLLNLLIVGFVRVVLTDVVLRVQRKASLVLMVLLHWWQEEDCVWEETMLK